MEIRIGNRCIQSDGRPYFIADIAANHDGSIERAFHLIELAKDAGADAAKFQNFKADKIVNKLAFDRMPKQMHQADWDKSVYDVYKEASIADEWSVKLKEKCDEVDIEYMTSPYDFDSVDLADKYVNAFKIGSGDITWIQMIEYIAAKNKPLLLATGAANEQEVDQAVAVAKKYKSSLILMQCNTNYTAENRNYKYINLNVLKTFGRKYPECILGLSDHTFGHTTVLGAFALGARVFEKHFTDDNNRTGPDHKFAMNPLSWREMVQACGCLYEAMGDGIKRIEDNENESRIVQQRVFYFQKDMKKNEAIQENDIFPLRPIQENAFYPYERECIIGKKMLRDVNVNECVRKADIADD